MLMPSDKLAPCRRTQKQKLTTEAQRAQSRSSDLYSVLSVPPWSIKLFMAQVSRRNMNDCG